MESKRKKLCAQLQKYFVFGQKDIEAICIKQFQPNRTIYKPGESIDTIYYIMSGKVSLNIQQKFTTLPSGIFLGDYETENQHPFRTTQLYSLTSVELAVLPFDFYFSIRNDYLDKQNILDQMLKLKNKKLKYLLKKILKEMISFRSEIIKFQKQDLGLIFQGIFKYKKFINVSLLEQDSTMVQKEFQLSEIGSGQFVQNTVLCHSPRGVLYFCKKQFLNDLEKNYEQFEKRIISIANQTQIRQERQKNIKKMCSENKDFVSSILPSILLKSNSPSPRQSESKTPKLKIGKKNSELKESQRKSNKAPYHFNIERTKSNDIESRPTFKNLSLIPLKKQKKPHLPSTMKKIWDPIKILKLNTELKEKDQYIDQIPMIFDSKFKRKMFLKASNPFHHRRYSTQENQDEEIKIKSESLKKINNQTKKLKNLKLSFSQYT